MLKYLIAAGTLVIGLMIGLVVAPVPTKTTNIVPQECKEAFYIVTAGFITTSEALLDENYILAKVATEAAVEAAQTWEAECEH